jgi:hypothetical protein
MLPSVRPSSLLLAAVGTTVVLTALSLWFRVEVLEPESAALFGQNPPTGFAVGYRLLNTDGERNIPTWFSAVLLMTIALVSLGVSTVLRDRAAPLRWYWLGLAAVFCFLSVDELASLHEELMPHLRLVVEARGALRFPWVVVAAPLVAVFALVYARFLWKLPRRTAGLLLVAGALYTGGAMGLEVFGGQFHPEDLELTLPYVLTTSVEEFLEMLGAALCLYAVADHARRLAPLSPADLGAGPDPDARGSTSAEEHPAGQRPDGGRKTAKGSVTDSSGVTNR